MTVDELTDRVSPAEAARLLGVTPGRVRQLCDRGVLAYTMTPLGRLIERSTVNRLAEERSRRAETSNVG